MSPPVPVPTSAPLMLIRPRMAARSRSRQAATGTPRTRGRIEEVVGDQRRHIERPVVLVAVVDHLDRRHAGAHGGADRIAIIRRARGRQIVREAHRDLAFDD